MPLRCLDGDHDVFALALDDAGWAALTAANRRDRHLRTRCCGAPVAAKTSPLKTRFFAHLARGGCATGDETPEHLHLKVLAVAAARARGWSAETEVRGIAPDGSEWWADVLATRGRHRVAVEVQWSPQSDDETQRRQEQYAASGVRCLWLFRQRAFPASQHIAAVRVAGSFTDGFTALGLLITDVLDAAFDRRLRFGIPKGATARVTIGGIIVACYGTGCGALNRAVERVVVCAGANTCDLALSRIGDHPAVTAAVLARLPRDRLRGRIRHRTMQGQMYLANACFRCDLPFGEAYLNDLNSRSTLASATVVIDEAWAAAIAAVREFDPAWWVVAPPRATD